MASIAALLSTAWLLAILSAPLLPTALSATVYAVGSLVCHQLSERSFHLGTSQLPVCGRCLGIYSGAALGALMTVAPAVFGTRQLRQAISDHARWMLVGGALPTVVTFALENAGLWPTTNIVRAAAGFPLGVVAALVVVSALATLNYRDQIRT
jgi:uncharacterized membrane protein